MMKPWLHGLLLFITLIPLSNAINLNQSSMKGMAQAYGFVLAQQYSLTHVAKEYPDLASRADLAQLQFNSTFPDMLLKLETQLKAAMGDKAFKEMVLNLESKLTGTLEKKTLTKAEMINFLDLVKSRAKGEIESPVLEYLLAVKYSETAVAEFGDGFRQRYQTDGTGKSQGIQLVLQLPRSWHAKDGERPHIVKKWMSENGTGLEMILLSVQDAGGYSPTKSEMEDFVRSGETKNQVPEGANFVAAGNFSLEKQTGYWLEMTMPVERAGMNLYQEILMYQFYFQGKAIGVQCGASGKVSDQTKVGETFQRIKPLCQQVLNSLVLLQAY